MQEAEEDKLRREVSRFIAENKPIPWVFLHKSKNKEGQLYTSCQGCFSDEDAFAFVKHIFKERPDVKIACVSLLNANTR